jgi:hypothetical protein
LFVSAVVLFCALLQRASCQLNHAQCTLLLRGHGSSSSANSSSSSALGLWVTAASLACNSSDRLPVQIGINTTFLQQHAETFSGVQLVSYSSCKAHAAAAFHAPIYALLYFCSSHRLTLLQPDVQGIALPAAATGNGSDASASSAEHQAILAFGGNITASVVGGRFANNLAGTALLVMQQASLTVTNTSISSSGGSSGVGAWTLDNSTLQISNSGFVKLAAAESGAAVLASNTSKVCVLTTQSLVLRLSSCMQNSTVDILLLCVTSLPPCEGQRLPRVGLHAVMCMSWHLLLLVYYCTCVASRSPILQHTEPCP